MAKSCCIAKPFAALKNLRARVEALEKMGTGTGSTGPTTNVQQFEFPVGYIYMSVAATSPAELFGGTWERIMDTFLLASGDTYEAGSTGGEAEHVLTEAEMPSHRHLAKVISGAGTGTDWVQPPAAGSGGELKETNTTNYVGGGQAHNNMPPYLAVFVWRRIA